MKNKLKLFFKLPVLLSIFCLLFMFVSVDLTQAATAIINTEEPGSLVFTPQVGLPGFMEKYVFTDDSAAPIATLMKSLFEYGIKIIGLLTLIVIIVGGFLWSTAGGSSQKVSEAKQWIFSGLSGLILVLFSYLILSTINVKLVNFNIPSIKQIVKIDISKSNQDQVFSDAGYLDRTFAETFGNNPTLPGCCIAYNFFKWPFNSIDFASLSWENGYEAQAEQACKEFVISHVDAQAPVIKMKSTQSLSPYTEVTIRNWTEHDFLNVGDHGYFINDRPCWSLGSYISNSVGLDNPNYCKNINNNGWACVTTDKDGSKSWGYCSGDSCRLCLSYGDVCSHDYQCPNRLELIGNSNKISGWVCGNGGLSGLSNNQATCDSTGHCECAANECYAECAKNLNNINLEKDACRGK